MCRLLNHMDENGYRQCVPRVEDSSVQAVPVIDLKSGYVLRSLEKRRA